MLEHHTSPELWYYISTTIAKGALYLVHFNASFQGVTSKNFKKLQSNIKIELNCVAINWAWIFNLKHLIQIYCVCISWHKNNIIHLHIVKSCPDDIQIRLFSTYMFPSVYLGCSVHVPLAAGLVSTAFRGKIWSSWATQITGVLTWPYYSPNYVMTDKHANLARYKHDNAMGDWKTNIHEWVITEFTPGKQHSELK